MPPQAARPAVPQDGAARTVARERAPGADGLSDDALRHILLELVGAAPAAVREFLVEGLVEQKTRDRWARTFTEPELARIVWLLEPTRHRVLIAVSEALFAAWDRAAPQRPDPSTTRREIWALLLDALSRHRKEERSVENLVRAFFGRVGALLAETGAPGDRGGMAERVLMEATKLAERKGHMHLRAMLSEHRAALMDLATGQGGSPSARPADRRPQGAPQPSSESAGEPPGTSKSTKAPPPDRVPSHGRSGRQRAFSLDEGRLETEGEPIHIGNAGLVIVGVFLPHLFTRLDVLEEKVTGGNRVRPDAVSRAVHLLQYLVDERTDTPEPLLPLNKVLCGVPLAVPVDREIEMTVRERELCDSLLEGLRRQWTIVKESSIAALRETFLQREGRLDHLATGWHLRVQRKTVDELMNYMPWSVSTIAHSWMPEPLYVTW